MGAVGVDSLEKEDENENYNDYIENVEVKDHPFDFSTLKAKRGACDFPARKLVDQVRGTQGPRFYNKITPSEQFAQYVNSSVDSMLKVTTI